jgi:hypothetical protein
VEAVLITPLGKDGRTKAEPRDEASVEHTASARSDEQTTHDAESLKHERATRDDLPVWML